MTSQGGRSSSSCSGWGGADNDGWSDPVFSGQVKWPESVDLGSQSRSLNEGEFSTDDFRMYEFKVRPCSKVYKHDWIRCPFYHPSEFARRNPRKHKYSSIPCKEFRDTRYCHKGDACEFAHGLFETYLHPAQYRTKLCRNGSQCTRTMCFFAHNEHELRPIYKDSGSAECNIQSQLSSTSYPSNGNGSVVSQGMPSTPRFSYFTGGRTTDTSVEEMLRGLQLRSLNTRPTDEVNDSPRFGMLPASIQSTRHLYADNSSNFNTSIFQVNHRPHVHDLPLYQRTLPPSPIESAHPNNRSNSGLLPKARRSL